MSFSGCERCSHRLGEERRVVLSFPIAGADNVDQLVSWQRPRARHCCLAWCERAAVLHPSIGLVLDDIATGSNDGGRYPAAMLQMLVGSVDDRIDPLLGEVALDYLDHP